MQKPRFLESIGVDYIDESEVLTPADEKYHINKWNFKVPFVCGATNLGEALRRLGEGAAMIRTKGEAGTGDVIEAVKHMRSIKDEIVKIASLPREELMTISKEMGAPYDLVVYVHENKKFTGSQFFSWRNFHSCRCRNDYAAWCRWYFRWFRYF